MICVGIVVAWCFMQQAAPTDSFCQVYQQVVQAKGDGSLQGTSGAKRRLLANELTYRRLCGNTSGK